MTPTIRRLVALGPQSLHLGSVILSIATATAALVTPVAAAQTDLPLSATGGAVVREFPPAPEWMQIVIRGDAAQLMFDSLAAVRETVVTRDDGTVFRVRHTAAMGCSISEIHASPLYACTGFYTRDGETMPGTMDPEMGGVARIGVSN